MCSKIREDSEKIVEKKKKKYFFEVTRGDTRQKEKRCSVIWVETEVYTRTNRDRTLVTVASVNRRENLR